MTETRFYLTIVETECWLLLQKEFMNFLKRIFGGP
jgi:hypothetical protein